MTSAEKYILPLDSTEAKLDNAGGKGQNLSILIQAGLRVPPGFIITTAAYRNFIKHNAFDPQIEQLTATIPARDISGLEQISAQIRELIESGRMPPTTQAEIKAAYQALGSQSVAVRSSATAEDLPGISFAGQQDTFLNITGEENLINAVVSSWSSLWTARAIGYRARYGIPHDQAAMAVVVQEMVASASSGVLFTANPLNGSRVQVVINATFGLGEALVSGQVDPDQYIVHADTRQVLERRLGSKAMAVYARVDGGLETRQLAATQEWVLPHEKILELTDIGLKIASLFQFPQDIEWAIAGEQLYILQSRPITTLYPLPPDLPAKPLQALFSFGGVQGILDPFTPLGQDAIRIIFAGGASIFGVALDHDSQPVIKSAGERLWANMTPVIQNPLGSRIIPRIFYAIDPSLLKIYASLRNEPDLRVGQGHLKFSTFKRLIKFAVAFQRRVFYFLRHPEGVADQVRLESQQEIERMRQKYSPAGETQVGNKFQVDIFQELFNAFPYAVPRIATAAAGGIIPFFLLNKISEMYTGSEQTALQISRGIENNVTTEMDLALWGIASEIRADRSSYQLFTSTPSGELATSLLDQQLPAKTQDLIASFLEKYGVRGLGEIDLGRKRWREDPTYIIELITNYLQIDDPELAPDAVFGKGKQVAAEAIKTLQSAVQDSFAGNLKSRLVGGLAKRVRLLSGLRESPKFHIIQIMGLIRESLLESGQHMQELGLLDEPEDIFFLYVNELVKYASGEDLPWRNLVRVRRTAYQRESLRKLIPRLILSDGRTFYEGLTPGDGQEGNLIGSPVSPGVVEGQVRVVMDPLNSDLQPGEIMVCLGTDPAWTPLFLTAAGLIMEVGGLMTHGAIVAREYGIPAAVGVSEATTKLQTGQRIRLNGSTGEITLLTS